METTDQIRDMISSILDGNNVGAQETFNDIVATKVSAALDDRKMELAQKIFNRGTEENA